MQRNRRTFLMPFRCEWDFSSSASLLKRLHLRFKVSSPRVVILHDQFRMRSQCCLLHILQYVSSLHLNKRMQLALHTSENSAASDLVTLEERRSRAIDFRGLDEAEAYPFVIEELLVSPLLFSFDVDLAICVSIILDRPRFFSCAACKLFGKLLL